MEGSAGASAALPAAAISDPRKARRELKKAAAAAALGGGDGSAAGGAAAAAKVWDRCMFFNAKKRKYCSSFRVTTEEGIMFCGLHVREVADPKDPASPQLQLAVPAAKVDTAVIKLPSGASAGLPQLRQGSDSAGATAVPDDASGAAAAAGATQRGVRVVCPVHPSHTVWAHRLKFHVRNCHVAQYAAARQAHHAFRSGANFGDMGEADIELVAALHASFEGGAGAVAAVPAASTVEDAGDATAANEVEAAEAGALAASSTRAASLLACRGLAIPPLAQEARLPAPRTVEVWVAQRLLPWYTAHVSIRPTPPAAEPYTPPTNTVRHKAQQDALIALLLAAAPALRSPEAAAAMTTSSYNEQPIIVEFGAGRAGLAHALATRGAAAPPGLRYVLVDRAAGRGRYDAAIRDAAGAASSAPAASVDRVPLDIGDFDLEAYLRHAGSGKEAEAAEAAATAGRDPEHGEGLAKRPRLEAAVALASPRASIIGIGKHLCGAATDLSLRCLATTAATSAEPRPSIGGVCIATCCHHVCNWRDYVGKPWWVDALGASAVDFEIARMVSAWGTAAVAPDAEHAGGDPVETALAEKGPSSSSDEEGSQEGRVCGLPKPVVGRMAKRLIDAGRAAFLAATCPTASGTPPVLAHYCDPRLSPENVALLLG